MKKQNGNPESWECILCNFLKISNKLLKFSSSFENNIFRNSFENLTWRILINIFSFFSKIVYKDKLKLTFILVFIYSFFWLCTSFIRLHLQCFHRLKKHPLKLGVTKSQFWFTKIRTLLRVLWICKSELWFRNP